MITLHMIVLPTDNYSSTVSTNWQLLLLAGILSTNFTDNWHFWQQTVLSVLSTDTSWQLTVLITVSTDYWQYKALSTNSAQNWQFWQRTVLTTESSDNWQFWQLTVLTTDTVLTIMIIMTTLTAKLQCILLTLHGSKNYWQI